MNTAFKKGNHKQPNEFIKTTGKHGGSAEFA